MEFVREKEIEYRIKEGDFFEDETSMFLIVRPLVRDKEYGSYFHQGYTFINLTAKSLTFGNTCSTLDSLQDYIMNTFSNVKFYDGDKVVVNLGVPIINL